MAVGLVGPADEERASKLVAESEGCSGNDPSESGRCGPGSDVASTGFTTGSGSCRGDDASGVDQRLGNSDRNAGAELSCREWRRQGGTARCRLESAPVAVAGSIPLR